MKFTEYKGLDLPKTAEEVLKFWEEQAIFEKSITNLPPLFIYFFVKAYVNG